MASLPNLLPEKLELPGLQRLLSLLDFAVVVASPEVRRRFFVDDGDDVAMQLQRRSGDLRLCTTSPAGLAITRISSSSWITSSAMSSARKAASSGRGVSVTSSRSPPRRRSRGRAGSPSTRTAPSSTSRASRVRDSPGSSRASAWSSRSPASEPSTESAIRGGASPARV